MTDKTDKCGRCGHQRKRHPVDQFGRVQCTAICNCTRFKEPEADVEKIISINQARADLELKQREANEGYTTEEILAKGIGPAHDPVNHPSHYTAYPGVEVIQLTRHMSFNRGNAVKYAARAGLKDKSTEVQDLEKAVWYLQDEIKLLKGEHSNG